MVDDVKMRIEDTFISFTTMHKPQREPEGCCLIVPKQSKEGLNPSSTAGPRVIIRTRNRTRKPSGLGISAKRDYAMEACYSQSRNKEEQRALRTEDVRRRHSALLSRLMTVQQRGHMKTEVVPSVHKRAADSGAVAEIQNKPILRPQLI